MDRHEANVCTCEIHDAADRIYALLGTCNPSIDELTRHADTIEIALDRLRKALKLEPMSW